MQPRGWVRERVLAGMGVRAHGDRWGRLGHTAVVVQCAARLSLFQVCWEAVGGFKSGRGRS